MIGAADDQLEKILSYMDGALDEAVDAAREVTGSDDISMMGSCSGGITSTAYFATLGGAVEKIKNMVLAVCLLDPNTADESAFGCLITPETMRAAKKHPVYAGLSMATI